MPDPYRAAEGTQTVASAAASALGAGTSIPNPMGVVQNAQAAYHTNQYRKVLLKGNQQAAANYEKAKNSARPQDSAQWAAANPTAANRP